MVVKFIINERGEVMMTEMLESPLRLLSYVNRRARYYDKPAMT